eukprot:scaffold3259_cov128-Skeletonema_dohrnii-CCMP3373.AAC.3
MKLSLAVPVPILFGTLTLGTEVGGGKILVEGSGSVRSGGMNGLLFGGSKANIPSPGTIDRGSSDDLNQKVPLFGRYSVAARRPPARAARPSSNQAEGRSSTLSY